MTDFERTQYYYTKGWATKTQVKQYVVYSKITPEQYTLITGDVY